MTLPDLGGRKVLERAGTIAAVCLLMTVSSTAIAQAQLVESPTGFFSLGYNPDSEVSRFGIGLVVPAGNDLWISPEMEFHFDSNLSSLFPLNLTAVKLVPAGESTALYFGGGGGWFYNTDCESECFSYAGLIGRGGFIKRTGRRLFAEAMILTRDGHSSTSIRIGIATN